MCLAVDYTHIVHCIRVAGYRFSCWTWVIYTQQRNRTVYMCCWHTAVHADRYVTTMMAVYSQFPSTECSYALCSLRLSTLISKQQCQWHIHLRPMTTAERERWKRNTGGKQKREMTVVCKWHCRPVLLSAREPFLILILLNEGLIKGN